ncbi:MAG: DNA helicase [Betaproteobacteria bacterium]|nr:MAG: DNA helicase [Betaproteobacteria bacterium]
MALTPAQVRAAQAVQHAAAHDPRQHVRVVAGPGTGKSSAIEERVRWLLSQGVQPAAIYAVSFTRASALDLRQRVHAYCLQNGQPAGTQVRVTTLHSLALRTLRAAGLLAAYPSEPQVMDAWELENVFDAEFGDASGIGKQRREKIRLEHEAFWSTGQWGPPNYVPPNPAITAAERAQFSAFHRPRTQCYACVLPGEIVRQCVTQMAAGTLNAVGLLNLEHLVVDEFQDLNPMDLEFVDLMVGQGARVFVAGDDDQSIYSFRFASPAGIQAFVAKYPSCGQHTLSACFRCTPTVLAAGQTLIGAHPQPNRIAKNHVSLYGSAAPPLTGFTRCWQFPSGVAEARAIAESCRALIAAGITPRDILVLLSNQQALLGGLDAEFQSAGVAYEPPRAEGFLDSRAGRWVLAASRIVCDADDYVAHRVLLGLRPGVGIGTCCAVTDAVIANNLNYQSIFYQPLPSGVFTGRAFTALNSARALCAQLQGWQASDTVGQHLAAIANNLTAIFSPADGQAWQAFGSALPAGMTLEELRDYLWADTDEQQSAILQGVMIRLNLPIPAAGVLPPRVRVMTMHGAKGLSAKVVFIPGLEEEILPGPWRQPYPGLVLEAARLLYVSITRARAACIMSYAQTRMVHGQFSKQTPSRFAVHLGGVFAARSSGLTTAEIAQITNEASHL